MYTLAKCSNKPSASKSAPTPTAKPSDKSFATGKSEDVSSMNSSLVRMRQGFIGETGLQRLNGKIYDDALVELRFPQSVTTYNKMKHDATVSAARNVFGTMIRKTSIHARPKQNNKSANAKKNAEFIEHTLSNLSDHTWRQVTTEIMTYDIFGFSLLEMAFEKIKSGKYKGLIKVKDLSPRAQASVSKWLWSDDRRKLIGFQQSLNTLADRATLTGTSLLKDNVKIPIKKCLHFAYNSTLDNPQGVSPLRSCYVTWQFKCLLEDYEGSGIARDMAGMPVFGIDQNLMIKALQDPTSPEASLMAMMEQNGANMHAGSQNFLINPIAYGEGGKPLFSFDLMGVSGGGKSYDIDAVIKRRQNEILMAYFADVLKLGQDGVGSFALADAKNNLLAHAVADHLAFQREVLQRQLVQTLAELNHWAEDDIPELYHSDVDDRDLDELGKFIQRCVSVGAMSVDQDLDAGLRQMGNLPTANYKKPIPDNALSSTRSRASDGMKTAGEGTSTTVGGKDKSTDNVENASTGQPMKEMFSILDIVGDQLTIQTPVGRVMDMSFTELQEFFS